jgi:nitroreductase
LEDLIKSRHSIRKWQDKPISEDLLKQAIELASWAPNAGNQQNWYFYIILKKEIIQSIADAVQSSADYIASWPDVGVWHERAMRMLERAAFFRNAPALIAVASSQYQSAVEEIINNREKTDERAHQMKLWRNVVNSRIQSVSSAIAYLLLILHQMGLGAVWMTGPAQAKGEIENILDVKPGLDIIALIPVGYPAGEPEIKDRKPVEQIFKVIK